VFSHSPESSDPLRGLRERLRQDTRDSFQLLENFWDNPICSIIHDEAKHCIVVVGSSTRAGSSFGTSMRTS
jgi:hypothetical protein